MPKLPVISGADCIKVLQKHGFQMVGQKGSHLKLRLESVTVIVPIHKTLDRGTLKGIKAAWKTQPMITLPCKIRTK